MGNVVLPMWAECPALTRLTCVGYPALSLILMMVESSALGWLVRATFTCSIDAIEHLQLWTLFLGPFYSPIMSGFSFIFVLFEIYMIMMYFPSQEKSLGSFTLLCWVLLMNALVNVIYLLVMLAFSLYYRGSPGSWFYWETSSNGLWPIIMVILTVRCLGDPQGSTSFWGMVQIPNKWYPVCLTAFFCLLSGMQILWNFVAALVIGYSYGIVRYDRLLPSRVRIHWLEERCCRCRSAVLGTSWIRATGTPGWEVEPGGRRYATLGDVAGSQLTTQGRGAQPPSDSVAGSGGGGSFTAFAGAGNRLGDGSDLAQPLSNQIQGVQAAAASPAADGRSGTTP